MVLNAFIYNIFNIYRKYYSKKIKIIGFQQVAIFHFEKLKYCNSKKIS